MKTLIYIAAAYLLANMAVGYFTYRRSSVSITELLKILVLGLPLFIQALWSVIVLSSFDCDGMCQHCSGITKDFCESQKRNIINQTK